MQFAQIEVILIKFPVKISKMFAFMSINEF
jgi:hypothetical protein